MLSKSLHSFDEAVALYPAGQHGFSGKTTAAYANMVGPFGGITAAVLVQAVCQHSERLGDPVALTVNFAGPLSDGEFHVDAVPVRTNRSTQHWMITLKQGENIVTTATAVTAVRRPTWGATELIFPQLAAAADLVRTPPVDRAEWTKQYDMRFVSGSLESGGALSAGPADEVEVGTDSLSQLWIRDEPPRPLDMTSLAAMCDAFYPRIFVRRPKWVPAGTVSLTTYFHTDAESLASMPPQHLLGVARAQHFGGGYFDQRAELWSADERLLATSHQLVYYKE